MVPRKPAQYLKAKARRMLIAGLGLLGAGLVLALLGFRWFPFSLAAIGLLVVAWQGTKPRGRRDLEPWVKGARGELMVAELLAELESAGFTTLHDLETDHGNVDHVVVGPTGVFVLETKNWKGKLYPTKGHLMHDGRVADEVLTQVRRGTIETKRRLELAGFHLWIEAVVVSTKAQVYRKRLEFPQVTVIEAEDLVAFIRNRRPRLDDRLAARAAAAIVRDDAPVLVRAIS